MIDRYYLGDGNEIALAYDFVMVSDRSGFGQLEVNLGFCSG